MKHICTVGRMQSFNTLKHVECAESLGCKGLKCQGQREVFKRQHHATNIST
jgi:hypothetical protein